MNGLGQMLREALMEGGRTLGPLVGGLTVLLAVVVLAALFWLTGVWARARIQKYYRHRNMEADVEDSQADIARAAANQAVYPPLTTLGVIVTLLVVSVLFAGVGTGRQRAVSSPDPDSVPSPAPAPPAGPSVNPPPPTRRTDGATGAGGSAGGQRLEDLFGEGEVVVTPGPCADWEEGGVRVEGRFYEQGYMAEHVCSPPDAVTATASYVVGRRFSRFTALVGMVDTSAYPGPVAVEVYFDDDEQRMEFTSDVRVGKPLEIDIDATDAVRVTIRLTVPPETNDWAVGIVEAKGVVR